MRTVLVRGQRVVVLAGLLHLPDQRVHRLQGFQVSVHPQAPVPLEDQVPGDVGLPPPFVRVGGPPGAVAVELDHRMAWAELGQEPVLIPDLEGPPGVKLGPSLPEPDVLRGDLWPVPPPVNDPRNHYVRHDPHRTGPAGCRGMAGAAPGGPGGPGVPPLTHFLGTLPGCITCAYARSTHVKPSHWRVKVPPVPPVPPMGSGTTELVFQLRDSGSQGLHHGGQLLNSARQDRD